MVNAVAVDAVRRDLAAVTDPEIPVLTIEDLGILRGVRIAGEDCVEVDITPTYSGCPALEVIRRDVEDVVRRHGFEPRVRTVLSPAWTTDWMSERGRQALHDYGIAPPGPVRSSRPLPVACPQCGSVHTEETSHFASTPCKALYRCGGCREPFDHFKPH